MPETEEQRRLRQADQAARTMFNVFPQGVGERVGGAAQAVAGAVGSAINRFSNPFGALASDIGAARQAVSGTRLIGRREPAQEVATAPTPVLPSGTPMVGFDAYPTIPQSIPQTASATAPQPATPLVSPSVPAFPTTGMGLMGNENIRPLPTEQFAAMGRIEPTLADRGKVSTDITGMQRATPIQTPYGTIYATPEQQANLQRTRTVAQQSSRSPAEQQALIAQIRQQGADLGQKGLQGQEQFFAQKRAEREALRSAESAARASGVRSMDIMRARAATQPSSTLAGIRGQAFEYSQRLPSEGLQQSVTSAFNRFLPAGGSRPLPAGPMGPSGYALYERQRMARGSSNPYSNVEAERRRRTRNIAISQGLQPALSLPVQEKQEDYFRRRGLM